MMHHALTPVYETGDMINKVTNTLICTVHLAVLYTAVPLLGLPPGSLYNKHKSSYRDGVYKLGTEQIPKNLRDYGH